MGGMFLGRVRTFEPRAPHPTLTIPGYELLRQYQTDLGFVLITNYDCPFEEAVSITLVAPDLSRAISTGTIGAAYYTFWLDEVEWIDADHFRLTCEDAVGDWLVTLRARHIPVLSPAAFIKRRVAPPTQPAA